MKRSYKDLISVACLTSLNQLKSWFSQDLSMFTLKINQLKKWLIDPLNGHWGNQGKSHANNQSNIQSTTIAYRLFVVNKKIWFGIFIIIMLLLFLILVVKPYSIKVQNQLSLNLSQSSHLKSLLIESQSMTANSNLVTVFDEKDLDRLKKLLLSKGIKPSLLALNSAEGARVDVQLNQVAFTVFLDFMDVSRQIWHLYPIHLSVMATNSPGIVNVDAKLMQFRYESVANSSGLVSN